MIKSYTLPLTDSLFALGLLASFWFIAFPAMAQVNGIKENLGASINDLKDQIIPVISLDGRTLYFSQNNQEGDYEIWYSKIGEDGKWLPKQKAIALNPPSLGSKYVFAEVEEGIFLVNGWFEQKGGNWIQSKGLSWYLTSQNRFIPLDIPDLQTKANGRFVNAAMHLQSKTLLLSFAENRQKNIYLCQALNPNAHWSDIKWKDLIKLPSPLNSEFNETTPYMSADGKTLYFASNRAGGFGQDDIYFSKRLDEGWMHWSSPQKLSFKINSNFSEIYYCLSPDEDYAYFVSYKHSFGAGDIFRLKMDTVSESSDSNEMTADSVYSIIEDSALTKINFLPPENELSELGIERYRPNNLVFLIDRSTSMRPNHKLPLLKTSLKRLVGELRQIDKITIMSFADSATIHFTTKGVVEKDSLYQTIDTLTASGKTKANEGLQLAYDYIEQNFIDQGNNEIILVTDGQFRLSDKDWERIKVNQQVVLTVVGLGKNQEALKNLKKLARKSKGSFIILDQTQTAVDALLEEVKTRSKR